MPVYLYGAIVMSISTTRSGRRAFTLVELLVVIGIIAMLVSILLPVLNKAKQRANAVKCESNLKTLMMGFIMFSNDYKGYLPGSQLDINAWPDNQSFKRDWLQGPFDSISTPSTFADAPQRGTIFKYVKNPKVYLCPSNDNNAVLGASGGTNSRFDYTSFSSLAGAKITKVKSQSKFTDQTASNRVSIVPTPVIVEEDATGINGVNRESGHSNRDQMSHLHNGGSFYASLDGSAQFFREPKVDFATVAIASWWTTIAPSGATILLGGGASYAGNPAYPPNAGGFGWFNDQ